jgi:uncharacterized protein YaiE (UPF0345 family)
MLFLVLFLIALSLTFVSVAGEGAGEDSGEEDSPAPATPSEAEPKDAPNDTPEEETPEEPEEEDPDRGHGNDPGRCDADNPGRGGSCDEDEPPVEPPSDDIPPEEEEEPGDEQPPADQPGDEDEDRGHGNDPDRCDADNPGRGRECDDEPEEEPIEEPVDDPIEEPDVPVEELPEEQPDDDAPVEEETPPVEDTPEDQPSDGGSSPEPSQPDAPEEPTIINTFIQLLVDQLSVIKGELVSITALLTGDNDEPLANKPVDFYADDQPIGTDTTDAEGSAEIVWDTSETVAGNFVIKAQYAGDGETDPSSSQIQITIEERSPNLITGAPIVEEEEEVRDALVKLVSNTYQCVDDCETIYQICPYGNDAETFDLEFKDRDRKATKGLKEVSKEINQEVRGKNFHARNLKLQYRELEEVEVPVYESCEQPFIRVNNDTGLEETAFKDGFCQVGTNIEYHVKENTDWEKFTPGKINQVESCFNLRVKGKIRLGDWVDNVISFAGYTYDEFAEWDGDVIVHTLTEDFNGTGTNVTNASDQLAAFAEDLTIEDFNRPNQHQWGNNWTNGSSNGDRFQNPIWNITNNSAYASGAAEENPAFGKHIGGRDTFDFTVDLTLLDPGGGDMTIGIAFGNLTRCVFNSSFLSYPCYKLDFIKGQDLLRLHERSNGVAKTANVNLTLDGVTSRYRFHFNGSSMFGKIWHSNDTEPVDWQIEHNVTVSKYHESWHILNLESDPGGSTNVTYYWDDIIDLLGGNKSAQWTYTSQKVDTGVSNLSLRINFTTSNTSSLTSEARIAFSESELDSAEFFSFSHNVDLTEQGQWIQYRFNSSHDKTTISDVTMSRSAGAYPYNITEDTGSDEQIDFNFSSTLTESNSPQLVDLNASAINTFLSTCTPDDNNICLVPLNFTANDPPESQVVFISLPLGANVTVSQLNISGFSS